MIETKKVRAFVAELVREFHPQRVVLFGSYAAGKQRPDSDIDLLVVMPHRGVGAEQAARIRQKIHPGFPLDLVVRSPAAIRRRLKMGDGFIREILETGKVLHEARDP